MIFIGGNNSNWESLSHSMRLVFIHQPTCSPTYLPIYLLYIHGQELMQHKASYLPSVPLIWLYYCGIFRYFRFTSVGSNNFKGFFFFIFLSLLMGTLVLHIHYPLAINVYPNGISYWASWANRITHKLLTFMPAQLSSW